MNGVIAAWSPGTSWLHRMQAGPKLALVALWSLVVVFTDGWLAGVIGLAIAVAVAASAGIEFRSALSSMRFLLFVLAIAAAFQTWQRGWQVAVAVTTDLLALFIVAITFTATTRIDELMAASERGLRSLRIFGLNPARIALAFSLVISSIPRLIDLAKETRDAARARGLDRNLRALLVPFALRSVAHAIDTGAALHARGIGDDDPVQ